MVEENKKKNNNKILLIICISLALIIYLILFSFMKIEENKKIYTIEEINNNPKNVENISQIRINNITSIYDTGLFTTSYGNKIFAFIESEGYLVPIIIHASDFQELKNKSINSMTFNCIPYTDDMRNLFSDMKKSLNEDPMLKKYDKNKIVSTYILNSNPSIATSFYCLVIALPIIIFIIPFIYNLFNYSAFDINKITEIITFNSTYKNKNSYWKYIIIIGIIIFFIWLLIKKVINMNMDSVIGIPVTIAFFIFIVNFIVPLFFDRYTISVDDTKIIINVNELTKEYLKSDVDKFYTKKWILPRRGGGVRDTVLCIVFNDGEKICSKINMDEYVKLMAIMKI